MKKIIFIIFIMAIYNNSANAQTPANDRNWDTDTLILSEGFKYSNYAAFTHSTIFDQTPYFSGTWGGCISNYSTAYNIWCTTDSNNLTFNGSGKGVVTMVTKKGPYYHPPSCSDSFLYTTTAFQWPTATKGGCPKYGYWEMRMRVPQYTGAASYTDKTARFGTNFWLTGNTNSQSHYSEIDMFEMNGWDNSWTGTLHYHDTGYDAYNPPNYKYPDIPAYDYGYYIYRTGHYPASGWPTPLDSIDSLQGYFYPPLNYNPAPANDTGWHKIGMDWEPNYVKWYIDDTLAKYVYYDYSVFNDGMNMIINTWLPGGVKLDKTGLTGLPPGSSFPYNWEIDYVKGYKLIADCSNAYSACSFNPSSYPWGVKKSIEFTGSSCTTDITSGQNVTLRATDHVTLDKNFKVEKGATFQIIMQPCPN